MDSESADDVAFKDYRELEPVSKSLGQYLVAGMHFAAALLISVIQLNDGLSAWFVGYGVVTPILLIIHGCIFFIIPNDSWYRERMVPFILSIFMTTEIETDRYLQYQRRFTMFVLILGWLAILICQMVWTFGITSILPAFATDDILILFAGELVGWTAILGPLFLYFLLLILIALILDRLLTPRYADIKHLFDIEKKWNMERDRRAKDAESVKSEDAPTDTK